MDSQDIEKLLKIRGVDSTAADAVKIELENNFAKVTKKKNPELTEKLIETLKKELKQINVFEASKVFPGLPYGRDSVDLPETLEDVNELIGRYTIELGELDKEVQYREMALKILNTHYRRLVVDEIGG